MFNSSDNDRATIYAFTAKVHNKTIFTLKKKKKATNQPSRAVKFSELKDICHYKHVQDKQINWYIMNICGCIPNKNKSDVTYKKKNPLKT